jgi:hypothetical protein
MLKACGALHCIKLGVGEALGFIIDCLKIGKNFREVEAEHEIKQRPF